MEPVFLFCFAFGAIFTLLTTALALFGAGFDGLSHHLHLPAPGHAVGHPRLPITNAALAALLTFPLTMPAMAQPRHDYRWQGDRNGRWDPSQHYHAGRYRERRLGRRDRIYRGGDGRYYCRRSDGTTGLIRSQPPVMRTEQWLARSSYSPPEVRSASSSPAA